MTVQLNLKSIVVGLFVLITVFVFGRFSVPVNEADSDQTDEGIASYTRSARSASSPRSFFGKHAVGDLRQMAYDISAPDANPEDDSLLSALVSEWAKRDALGALAFAQELERDDLMYLALLQFGEVDAEQGLQWIQDNVKDLTMHGYLASAVYKGLMHVDPDTAISQIQNIPDGPKRNQLLFNVIDEWSLLDIDAAFDWIEQMEPTPLLSAIHGQVLGRYIDQSPQEAIGLISAMADSDDKANFVNRAAFALAHENPEKAIEWIETMSGDAKHFGLLGVVERWASNADGIKALDFVASLENNSDNKGILTMAAMKLSQSHPEELAARLPSLDVKHQVVVAGQLAQVYSAHSPEKTAGWLATLENDKARDAALKVSLKSFRQYDIDQAFQLSESMSNDAARFVALKDTLLSWVPVNQAAAEVALQQTTKLSEQDKAYLLILMREKSLTTNDLLIPAK